MKRIVNVTEVDGEGLVGLLGQRITVWCMNYIYTGELVGVNDTDIRLDDAAVVYETGSLNTKDWQDAQALSGTWYVRIAAIESYGVLK